MYISETMYYDPNFEYGRFNKYIDRWRGLLLKYNVEMKESPKEKNNEIIAKYRQVRTGQTLLLLFWRILFFGINADFLVLLD